ncbi:MAG: cell division protein ZapA [Deltaproteobacteria bacterium]|nr:cell division protein ZapA [Deltaproteobacteria bacterium]MBW1928774.1 cell division protein ZapA [Deltaproteobacteria bacterium]MBW2024652.1 cell division protein ZapA [Deltaproteobacteria bacterium]MBW2124663.1 cell division protein ZapA [Deltaproteobacteria bacterium]RLB24810.1 MAG: cell division protein ZapA [Deltaproteobacteria bacterium]
MKERVTVKILDQEYQLLSEESSEHVEKIAQFLDGKLREMKAHGGALSDKKLAILAAFHIASEYFQLKEMHDTLIKAIESRTEALLRRIGSMTQ